MSKMRFVVADTEGCGLGKNRLDMCEVALREIDPVTLDTIWEWQQILNPGRPIPQEAINVHGITDEMCVGAPTWEDCVYGFAPGDSNLPSLRERFEGDHICLIMHNASFDTEMLLPLGTVTHTICTLASTKRLFPKGQPGMPTSFALQALRGYFNMPENEHHRAMGDVITTHRVLKECLLKAGQTLEQFYKDKQPALVMPFGDHIGKLISTLSDNYLLWLHKNAGPLLLSSEMQDRVKDTLKDKDRVAARGKVI